MRSIPILLLITIGCGPGGGVLEIATTTEATTSPATTITTTTPSTLVDADWVLSGTLEISADAEVPEGDVWVTLTSFNGEAWGDIYRMVNLGPIQAGDSLPYQIGLDDIPEAHWFYTDPLSPDFDLAGFSFGAFIDVNGDELADFGDTYVASQIDFISYFRGTIDPNTVAAGAALGWNDIDFIDFDGNAVITSFSGDLSNYTVHANLLPTPPIGPLGGVILPELDRGPDGQRRVDIVSINAFVGLPSPVDATLMSAAVDRGPANQLFNMDPVTPTPPEDHFATDLGEGAEPGLEFAVYSALAYVDLNNDGQWQVTDGAPLATNDAVTDQPAVSLMYLRATGWEAAGVAWLLDGLGWKLFTDENDAVHVQPWTQGLRLDTD